MVASGKGCAADANADNTRARAFFLLFILIAILPDVAGIILDHPSLPAVRKAPLQAPGRRGATRPTGGGPASSLAAAGT